MCWPEVPQVQTMDFVPARLMTAEGDSPPRALSPCEDRLVAASSSVLENGGDERCLPPHAPPLAAAARPQPRRTS